MNTTSVSKYAGNVILVGISKQPRRMHDNKDSAFQRPNWLGLGRGRSTPKLSTGSPFLGRQLPSPPPPKNVSILPAQESGPYPSMLPAASLSKGQLCCNKKGGLSPSLSTSKPPLSFGLSLPGTLHRDRKRKPPAGSCCVGGAGEASGRHASPNRLTSFCPNAFLL